MAVLSQARWLRRGRIFGWSGILLLVEMLALAFLVAWSHGTFAPINPPTTTDFVSFYAAGKLALAGLPALAYDQNAHHAAEIAVTAPGIGYQFFFYPPIYLLLCAPLARLPYLLSFVLFEGVTLALWLGVARCILAARDWAWCLPVLAYPAVFWTIGLGQNAMLTATLLGVVMLLIDTRPRTAGLMLGLLCYKPHLALLAPIALAAGGYWRVLATAALSVMATVALSVVAFGLAPWHAYLGELANAQAVYATGRIDLAAYVTPFGAARMLGVAPTVAYALQLVASVMVAVVVFWIWRRDADPARRGATLAGGILLSVPVALLYDLMIPAIAILWLVRAASRGGFLPWEKLLLAVCYLMPLVCRYVGEGLGIPLAPLAPVVLLAMAVARSLRARPLRETRHADKVEIVPFDPASALFLNQSETLGLFQPNEASRVTTRSYF
jgi:alpha-1,2-mannosyltransferase